jgi:tRNA(Ile)-lysidine synthase
LRVRVRHEALPLLEQLSPQIVRHLNALADALNGSNLPSIPGLEGLEGETELNRAQIAQVLRATRLGRGVTIRVAGGRELRVLRPAEIKS